jgi:glycosyltransferase involved in cell wall biosynthesis
MARIAFLDQYAGLGGGQRILMDLVEAARAAGHEPSVFLPGEGVTEGILKGDAVPVHDLPLPQMTPGRKPLLEKVLYPLNARRASAALIRTLKEHPADLLYANGPRTYLPSVMAAGKLQLPVVCGLHLIFRGGAERKLIRWCFSKEAVKRVIFCSEAVAEPFGEFVDSGKGVIQLYWVSPSFLEGEPDRERCRERFGIGPSEIAVGVLGRVSPTKGQVRFLEALCPLLTEFPNLRLVIAGEADFESPDEEEKIRRLAAESPAPERIHYTGEMVDSAGFLDALDVLVVPSQWDEPFGLVAVEGMARRLPVAATGSGGLREIVVDGETGFHLEKSAESIREAVRKLIESSDLRRRMGEAGRRRVEDQFHPRICTGRIMEHVNAAL